MLKLLTENSLSVCRKNTFAFIAISIIILSIYSNTYNTSWHLDDENNILKNQPLHLNELNWQNIKNTFFANIDGSGKIYRPVACLSFAINYYFGKTNVFGYHLFNISIHLIASIFLFLFIYHTLNLPSFKAKYGPNSYFTALLATVLWAINPVHTQAVTYIIQRMASMAGMFYIIAMYFYLKGRATQVKSTKILFYSSCALSCLLSFASKENTILLPITLLLYEILLVQKASLWEWLQKNMKIFPIIIALILITILFFLYFILGRDLFSLLGGYEHKVFSLKERLLTEPRIIIFYISLLLYPVSTRLCLDHDISISYSLLNPPSTLLSILLIMSILIGVFLIAKKLPLISFCIIFFFLNHIIESSFIPLELVFEHRNYLPSMLFFLPVAIFFIWAISCFSQKKAMQSLVIFSVVLLLVGQGHSTYIRNLTWKTEESLWLDCIEKYPDRWRAYLNLGRYYSQHNMHKEALSEYTKALSKKYNIYTKEKYKTYYNMGVEYQKIGEKDKAFRCYLEAERIYPFFANIHVNKGILLAEKGSIEDAIYEFNEALIYNNKLHHAHSNLGFLLLKTGQTKKAIYHLELARDIKPDNTIILRNLGHAYRIKGLHGKAFIMFKMSKDINPYDPITLLHLAELYSTTGMKDKIEEVIAQFISILKRDDLHKFIEELGEEQIRADRLLPDRMTLFSLLARAFQDRSQLYQGLADYCIHKKSELARKPVHFDQSN